MRRVEFEYDPASLTKEQRDDLARVLTADWAQNLTSRDVNRLGPTMRPGVTEITVWGAGRGGSGGLNTIKLPEHQPSLFSESATDAPPGPLPFVEGVREAMAREAAAEDDVESIIKRNSLSPAKSVVYRLVAEAGRVGMTSDELIRITHERGQTTGQTAATAASQLRTMGLFGRRSGGYWVLQRYIEETLK